MTTSERGDFKPMYSWWWVSHISPKNSIWLQENLKDMDAKVKQMIRLVEEDTDSFASKAEMCYNRRPVLMELVEEFYRAYHALAGRYDHATGVIRQAHRIMAEAVPNQIPFVFVDKSSASSHSAVHSLFDLNDFSKDVSDTSSSHFHSFERDGDFAKESYTTSNRLGLKQVNDFLISGEVVKHANLSEGMVGRIVSCDGMLTEHRSGHKNEVEACVAHEPGKASKNEAEILAVGIGREPGLLQDQQSWEMLTNLEFDVSQAQEDSRRLNARANKAEEEIEMIKEALVKLGSDKEASLVQELEGLRAKVKNLEESVQSLELLKSNLPSENDFLSSRLQTAPEVSEKLSEKNQFLDSSLFDAKAELEILRTNFNNLSYIFLDNEKLSLVAERESLSNMLKITQQALDDLERRHMMMNEMYTAKEERIKSLLKPLKELQIPLNGERENLARYFNILFEEMERHHDGVKMIHEDQEEQILILTEACDRQRKKNESLPEANKELEPEPETLLEQIDGTKISIERLQYELQKGEDAVQLWETWAEIAFVDLQTCDIRETLFLEKIHELTEVYLDLEASNDASALEIDLLKGKINDLMDENGEMNAQLAACIPVVAALNKSVAYLESHTLHYNRLKEDDSDEMKVLALETHCCPGNSQKINYIQSDLLSIDRRIRAVDKAVLEMEKLSWREVSNASDNLEVVMKQTENLKSERIGEGQSEKLEGGLSNEVRLQKPVPEEYDNKDKVMARDIVLDQVSLSSSHGRSWRENLEFVELWDNSIDNDYALEITRIKRDNTCIHSQQNEDLRKDKSGCSSEITVEKELGVDRLVLSNRFIEPNEEETRKKILIELNLDAQKLTNLAVAVRDLKVEAYITWKRKAKCFDYDRVKGQLEEADVAVKKLFDINSKLTKNISSGYFLIEGKSAVALDERSIFKEIFFREARVASEKIGRLQSEVQKLESLLLRFNKGKEKREETKIARIIKRIAQKQNRALHINCLHSRTKGN